MNAKLEALALATAAQLVVAAVVLAMIINAARAGDQSWRAHLVIILSTERMPIATYQRPYPDVFFDPADCDKFIRHKRDDVSLIVKFAAQRAPAGRAIVHHELTCLQNFAGQPL